MPFPRSAGILLHPTSLPSRDGVGDFGPAAYRFVDFLASARQGVWQVLPLGPLGYGNSPYSSTSAFAGNPLLISLEGLIEHGWIEAAKLGVAAAGSPGDPSAPVEYDQVFARKMRLLFKAARSFLDSASGEALQQLESFQAENSWWLEDFVLFDALRARYKLATWNHWPEELKRRAPAALEQASSELAGDIRVRSALQFAFHEQWRALRHYCAERAVRVVGDVAIFVNHDSADVWTKPELFRLDQNLEPEVVAGVPPDAFSTIGQRWGNPLYRWDVMKEQGYDWWIRRLRWATQHCDFIRLDHFRGFDQFWTWASSLRKCMLCGNGCRFPAWRFCNSLLATRARTSTYRTVPRAKSSIPEPTITIRSRDGGRAAPPIRIAATSRPTWDAAMTAFTGRSSAQPTAPRRASALFPCRIFSAWAAKPA
jgi:4-alpha-glucanotransferase